MATAPGRRWLLSAEVERFAGELPRLVVAAEFGEGRGEVVDARGAHQPFAGKCGLGLLDDARKIFSASAKRPAAKSLPPS